MNAPKYKVRELTPEPMKCIIGSCPAVYEVAKECLIASCPAIYGNRDDAEVYLIVGKRLDPKEFGLAEKVSQEETLVAVPKNLIDRLHSDKK